MDILINDNLDLRSYGNEYDNESDNESRNDEN